MISSWNHFFILTYILLSLFFKYGYGEIDIDMDHIKLEPNCGKLPTKSSSRVSNAQDSPQLYPWVVAVSRSNEFMELQDNGCMGAIITKNSVVTAAHCICGLTSEKDLKAEPHIRDKIVCKGGRGNVQNKNNLPNEVTIDNEIEVGAGDRNYRNLDGFEILYAYVHDEYEDPLLGKTVGNPEIDVALLKTYETESDKDNFYDNLKSDFKIGPICLGAENGDFLKEDFETVGWGLRYGELREEQTSTLHPDPANPQNVLEDPIANKHSCTTNSHGPLSQVFKHCDVGYLKTQSWNCVMNVKSKGMMKFYFYLTREMKISDKQTNIFTNNHRRDAQGKLHYYPPHYDADECIKLWNKADMTMKYVTSFLGLKKVWMNTKIIEIGISKRVNNLNLENDYRDFIKMKTCYKDELFHKHGWCFTEGQILEKGWGFCDSSCEVMPFREDTTQEHLLPEIYQKMTWEVDDKKSQDHCIELESARAPWFLCTKSSVPSVTISYFHMKNDGNLKYIGNFQRSQKNFNHYFKSGFQQTCPGDSGGGHWNFNSKRKRATLIGITSMSGLEYPWCSSPSVIVKLTYPSIQNWIKKHAKIT